MNAILTPLPSSILRALLNIDELMVTPAGESTPVSASKKTRGRMQGKKPYAVRSTNLTQLTG